MGVCAALIVGVRARVAMVFLGWGVRCVYFVCRRNSGGWVCVVWINNWCFGGGGWSVPWERPYGGCGKDECCGILLWGCIDGEEGDC